MLLEADANLLQLLLQLIQLELNVSGSLVDRLGAELFLPLDLFNLNQLLANNECMQLLEFVDIPP